MPASRAEAEICSSQLAIPRLPVGWTAAQPPWGEGVSGAQAALSLCEPGGYVAGGQQTVVANTNEATRQYVLEEATQKLDLGSGLGLAVAGPKGDRAVRNAQQTLIADANTVCVSSEVA